LKASSKGEKKQKAQCGLDKVVVLGAFWRIGGGGWAEPAFDTLFFEYPVK
jgi:hypothetical protein